MHNLFLIASGEFRSSRGKKIVPNPASSAIPRLHVKITATIKFAAITHLWERKAAQSKPISDQRRRDDTTRYFRSSECLKQKWRYRSTAYSGFIVIVCHRDSTWQYGEGHVTYPSCDRPSTLHRWNSYSEGDLYPFPEKSEKTDCNFWDRSSRTGNTCNGNFSATARKLLKVWLGCTSGKLFSE